MIDVATAGHLLDFASRIGPGQRANAQLEGAVAIHNLLASEGVAYLADEVGMGKTYVALGALALFRHFQPDFRVLVIAPRENIQRKWMKEMRNFVRHNVRFPDLRVKSIDNRPARSLVRCDTLLDLVHEATLDPHRDFFMRLTSFSLAMPWRDDGGRQEARRLRDGVRRHLPWLKDEVFDLRAKHTFKDNFARATCCSLDPFDLVIVDEAHNLKHGYRNADAARNRVLGLCMGHPDVELDQRLFPGYGPRAKKVLFLSATPVEETYQQLWNQLDVFGKAQNYGALVTDDASDGDKKRTAARFLIRRVTEMRVADATLTKNQYRREWRRGGLATHDEPICVADPRQRLIVALIQKKVAELLGGARFKSSFQVGMLASFESFLETTKLKSAEDDANFDDAEQTNNEAEKEGIDVTDINRLARSYRERFGREMPHPKMDAIVDSLMDTWRSGEKALVFVRRVASVWELKRKLDERYDDWLIKRLTQGLSKRLHGSLERLTRRYHREQALAEARRRRSRGQASLLRRHRNERDGGGHDTFFAWFFRGDGPPGVVSGATIQQRFASMSGTYGTFFRENHVAAVLGCHPGEVESNLAMLCGTNAEAIRADVMQRITLSSHKTKQRRVKRFDAVQAAAIQLLTEHPAVSEDLRERARLVWDHWFNAKSQEPVVLPGGVDDVAEFLEVETFFTSLRRRPELKAAIWPEPTGDDALVRFKEQELRAQLLATANRLGHGLIDLYILAINRLDSLKKGSQEQQADDEQDAGLVGDYLQLLEAQMAAPLISRDWGAFDELAEISQHFDLILDVNEPTVRETELREAPVLFARLLREQQPVGGMSGQVNQTLVRQFRMPGYPFVLVTTDVLQEGEDLHTFCSAVHHYGISWTPSSMEQRTGRIDRVRSATDRRLSALVDRTATGDEKLQVYFPHLEDTVELLQVQRVLERMNVFLQLMHEGLTLPAPDQRSINAEHEFAKRRREVPQLAGRLQTAFPIMDRHLQAKPSRLAVEQNVVDRLVSRFTRLRDLNLAALDIEWEAGHTVGRLTGTVRLGTRQQPFTLLLRSIGSHPLIRCVSPVGSVGAGVNAEEITDINKRVCAKIGAILTEEERSYDLTVEGEVLLAANAECDAARIGPLIRRVTQQADTIELQHLSRDEPLQVFREDLAKESAHEE